MSSARNSRRLAAKDATWTQRREGRFDNGAADPVIDTLLEGLNLRPEDDN